MRASTLLLLALVGLSATPSAQATNFLVIVLDDLGADKVSSYKDDMYPGYSPTYVPDTPAIDALAEAGLRFSNAYANPVCTPTRASLMTGLYPFQHDLGAIINATSPELNPDTTSLADMLDATPGGYESSLFGKWHLGTTSVNDSDWTTTGEKVDAVVAARHGFDAYAGNLDGQVSNYYDWLEARWPLTISTGGVGSMVTQRTDWTSDATITDTEDWLALQANDWFTVVSLNVPHLDSEGEDNVWEADDLAPEDGASCIDVNGNGKCNNSEMYLTLAQDGDERVQWLLEDMYAADPALLADTVIILLGDNGTPKVLVESPWTAAGERADMGKNTAYETGARVPFIITRGCDWIDLQDGALDGYIDGVDPACADSSVDLTSPGLTIDFPVQVEDVFATIAELSGSTADVPSASTSLVPCLTATSADSDDCGYADGLNRPIYTEKFTRPYSAANGYGTMGAGAAGTAGLKIGTDKIIATISSDGGTICVGYEFYDLSVDPFETDNLLAGAAMTATQQAAYDAAWLALRSDIAPDWFPQRNCTNDSLWDADHDYYEDAAHGGGDCDDTNAAVNPAASETWYDGVDGDCAGGDDYDQDGDGYTASAYGGTDCDDTSDSVHPGGTDTWYDGVDGNCDGANDYDRDGDGVTSSSYGGSDCNDTNAAVKPGATEACNSVDDNCNGATDEGATTTFYRDVDGDGYGNTALTTAACTAPTGYVAARSDCNDANASINPGRTETCNGVDDNCSGATDEGVTTTYYRDADGDGHGNPSVSTASCSQPAGYVTNRTDCNDSSSSVYPGRTETCNNIDDNCSGTVDEGVKTTFYRDADADGYGTSATTTQACTKPGGYVVSSTDCDDTNAAIKPGAAETCNGVDDNCSGTADEGVTTTFYRDADSDGYGSATVTTAACSMPAGYVGNSSDCNDASASIKPGASETCNSVDDNCDGTTDEGATTTFYRDADNDGYGTTTSTTAACTTPSGYVSTTTDCDDGSGAIYPGAPEVWYDGVDEACDGGSDFDADADGDDALSGGGADCDDGDAAVSSLATEVWYDGVDQDCLGDDDYDQDGDGEATTDIGGLDCDDTDAAVYPGAADTWYDGVDQDCAGDDDFDQDGDGEAPVELGGTDCDDLDVTIGALAEELWYDGIDQDCAGDDDFDQDGDTFVSDAWDGDDCDDTDALVGPGMPEILDDGVDQDCDGVDAVSGDGVVDTDGDGYPSASDCDDLDPTIHPGAVEVWYNGVDEDCSGGSDTDQDADGVAASSVGGTDCDDTNPSIKPGATDPWYDGVDSNCDGANDYDQDGDGTAATTGGGADCNDTNASVRPGATETCNGVDDNCSGAVDEGVTTTYFRDADNDGYGSSTSTTAACALPAGYVTNSSDCNDASAAVNPGAAETCNNVDDNCSGAVDEGVKTTYYRDADADGYGTTSSTSQACTRPGGYSTSSTDCNDANASINPGVREVFYDGVDANCDGRNDYDRDFDGYTSSSYGGTDCNDTNAVINPAATEVWYNGIDNNCDGLGDYDQDGDGAVSTTYGGTDCNDTNAAVKPGATETCNGVDDNCSGTVDEGLSYTQYRDADGDSYGDAGTSTSSCSAVSGYVTNATDCNDGNSAVNPGATETCNGVDDNCSGSADEGVSTTYYRDSDNDGYGNPNNSTQACSLPAGYTTNSQDCNDTNNRIKPGALETRNDGVDTNCNGADNY